MRFIPLLFLSLALASEPNEVEGLLFGKSYHFQNRDAYDYRENNPGVGLSYWRTVGDSPFALGVTVASFRNSYDTNSMAVMPCIRYTARTQVTDLGVIAGYGTMSGYDTEKLRPHLSGFIGGRVKLHASYLPYKAGCDYTRPSSSAVVLWLSVSVATW